MKHNIVDSRNKPRTWSTTELIIWCLAFLFFGIAIGMGVAR